MTKYFRLRVGMGWFSVNEEQVKDLITFSSPSGDRLVPIEDVHAYNEIEIFVPAWGWVGSGVRFSSLG